MGNFFSLIFGKGDSSSTVTGNPDSSSSSIDITKGGNIVSNGGGINITGNISGNTNVDLTKASPQHISGNTLDLSDPALSKHQEL